MTLPDLVDYDVPRPFPASRASWEVDPARAAVLVHDLQQYFVRPFAPGCPALQTAVHGVAQILRAARAQGLPVLYTAQTGERGPVVRGLQGDLWGPGMRAIPEHTDILDAVAPEDGDVMIAKHRYSAFAHTELAGILSAAGRDQLIITGVYAHIGVLATAYDAFQREIHPFVVGDAVADLSRDSHLRALEQVASCSGVVTTTAAVLDALAADAGEGSADDPHPVDAALRTALGALLPGGRADEAFADPDADLFALGLDSLRAFDLLDALADAGVDVEFGAFTRAPTIEFLRSAAAVPQ